jgi:uncharacterized membrane protein
MSGTAPSPRDRRTPRWVRVVLVLSLTINLAGFGWLGGQYLRETGRDPALTRSQAMFLELLPAGRRDEARAVFARGRGDLGRARIALLERTMDALEAIRAEPFSRDALAEAVARRRAAALERRATVQAQFVEVVSRLAAEERRAVAERVERRVAPRLEALRREVAAQAGGGG